MTPDQSNSPVKKRVQRLSKRDLQYCRKTLNNGSRSFLAASHLLPSQMRNAATALYAFCREADDLIDLSDNPEAALYEVRLRVNNIYSGKECELPADRALACVVRHYQLPKALLDDLIEGFAWDTTGRVYKTLAEVEDYAARVAGTVGAMMAVLMGARAPAVVARACDLGVAMQLTNICRDVGEDARNRRCYLPEDWLTEAGLCAEDILKPESEDVIADITKRLLARADVLYQRADNGIASLPVDFQRGIRMARHLYAAIGDEIAATDYRVLHHRAYVPGRRKIKLVAKHWSNANRSGLELLDHPPLMATTHLVNAVTEPVIDSLVHSVEVYNGLVEKPATTHDEMISVLNLMDRLEHTKRHELNASNGKVPFGFTGVVRHQN